jgi:transcriptional regulator with XRE-family HTH domain
MTAQPTRGDRLRALREGLGITNKSEFARAIGVRPESLWRYETNREQPSAEVLVRAARAYHADLDHLLGESPRASTGAA